MDSINKGGEDNDRLNALRHSVVNIRNWLSEQNSSVYGNEIEAIEHAMDLMERISQKLNEKPYVSLTEVFDTNLTPSEFTEYQALGGLDIGDDDQGKNIEQLKRKIFFDKLCGGELKRADAEKYASLKILEKEKTASSEQLVMLQIFEERLSKDTKRKSLELQTALNRVLKSRGIDPEVFKIQSQISLRADEITDSLMKRVQKQ